jgi:hypothetical protein
VQLLEYAEEELECERVYMVFSVRHPNRDAIVKTFMFLGFVPVTSTNPGLPPAAVAKPGQPDEERLMFMGYTIE